MSTGELVTDLRDLDRAHLNLDKALHLFVRCEHDLIDVALLRVLERHRLVFIGLRSLLLLGQMVELRL